MKLDVLPLGDVPRGLGTPSFSCLVDEDGVSMMRIDVYGEPGSFAEAQIWHNWVVIGFAEMVHFKSSFALDMSLQKDKSRSRWPNALFGYNRRGTGSVLSLDFAMSNSLPTSKRYRE